MEFFVLAQEHGIDPTHIDDSANLWAAAWAWGIFVVLVLLLWKLAWGPIAKGLTARADRISESLAKAAEIEKAASGIAETNRRLLAQAQQEAQHLVTEARAAAKNAADDVLKKTHADIEAQRERFTRETQLLVDKARADLRRETVDLTIEATAKLLGKTATSADHRRLAEEALHDAENVTRN